MSLRCCVFTAFWVAFLLPEIVFSQSSLLQSGPMLGYAEQKEVLLWAQTKKAATVQFDYWDLEKPAVIHRTAKVRTEKATAFTAKCIADELEPGRSYGYLLRINGKRVKLPYPTTFKTQTLWQWRTDPPAFTLATGSCFYVNETPYDRPGKPYGSDYQIMTSLAKEKPDLMLWLGDNTYTREPDWATRLGMLRRYTHTRSLPELQPFLASTNHYAIWDDHDYGPDDSDGNWIMKDTSWEVFKAFWGNPSYGLPGQKGCTTYFKYNDVDFFLLDDRYFRTPNYCKTCERTQLGEEQLEWLIGSLANSRAPFKIVATGGQVLTTNRANETYINFSPAERDTLLARIEREKIKGVIFLTGDRHFTELSAMKNANGNWVYDLTASSLTAGSFTEAATKTQNDYRVEGTVVAQHNYALLRFSGPRTDRQLDISVHDADGRELWKKTIKASEL
ncbi:MAG TPA: alkaline phosphatase D family protein [Saprospiraceae bacterium]|nr:alkaline phosphatase D family protein [Saprospiraceae bacterium]